MDDCRGDGLRVAVVWRGSPETRRTASGESSRLKEIFAALKSQGLAAEPAVFDESVVSELREQLLANDGVLVWVDPVATDSGLRRSALDEVLREVARAGVMVSTHPDVTAKMGVKAVLARTKRLGWGTDTHFYETEGEFAAEFPARLASGARVLKQNRGNGGIGVWKVELIRPGVVLSQEARRDSQPEVLALPAFIAARTVDLVAGDGLVDQPFQTRLLEGMVRCYMSEGEVAGFGHQMVTALGPPEAGPPAARLYSGPDDPRFQRLRALMERDWTPAMVERLGLDRNELPVIWDADFLLGPTNASGEDSYVLCEINVSSVFPIPDEAPAILAATVRRRLQARVSSPPSS